MRKELGKLPRKKHSELGFEGGLYIGAHVAISCVIYWVF